MNKMKTVFIAALSISMSVFSDVLYWTIDFGDRYAFANNVEIKKLEFDIQTIKSIGMSVILYELLSEYAEEMTDDVTRENYPFSFENFNRIEFGSVKLNGLYL